MRTELAAIVGIAFLAGACGGGGKKSGSNVVIEGDVSEQGTSFGTPSSLSGATVSVLVAGAERESATSDSQGHYRLAFKVAVREEIVLRVTHDGDAPFYRTLSAAPGATLPMNATVRQLEDLTCASAKCGLAGNKMTITGLPSGFSGGARVFNPVSEADAFPGDFSDSNDNLLLSGVFGSVALTDGSGNPVDQLPGAADLKMELPRDTWPIVKDMTTGNGAIDVPLYSWDETLGTWVQEGQGVLVDDAGTSLPESALASIKDGSYTGAIFASGSVTHFSYWNIDWPVASHTCITGTVVDAGGAPATGATVTVTGVTYNGTSHPITVGPDGKFCVEVMRSENVGEDVDQDGVTGETQQVSIRVYYQGTLYDGGTIDTVTTQSTCAAGNCTDLGNIALDPAHELTAAMCAVHGTVRHAGVALAGAQVYGYDPTLPDDVYTALCGTGACVPAGVTDGTGAYTLSVPVLGGLDVQAYSVTSPSAGTQLYRYGGRNFTSCPAGSADVDVSEGYEYVTLTVTESAGSISWSPARPATELLVDDATSNPVWFVAQDTAPFAPPVTYGVVPAGAAQAIPATGAPPALASGDTIFVYTAGTTTDGLPSYGTGQLVLP